MNTTITTYQPKYEPDFIRLNKEWIENYYSIEPADFDAFENTKRYIIDSGGQIFFALNSQKEVIGTVALIKHTATQQWELAKMAVSPKERGKGTGYLLGKALIDYAKENQIAHIYLEGNTQLKASIVLYHKLGFKETAQKIKHYDRVNITLQWDNPESLIE